MHIYQLGGAYDQVLKSHPAKFIIEMKKVLNFISQLLTLQHQILFVFET